MKRIDIRDVIEIKNNKISYKDADGNISFIELHPCAINYAQAHGLDISNSKHKCVGERLLEEPVAYYELWSTEHTQLFLEFKSNAMMQFLSKKFGWNFHTKEVRLFHSIQKQLNANGYSTLDLS